MKRILVIDDDKLFQRAIDFRLKEAGYEVTTAGDAFQALELIDKYKIDGVVSDIMMPDISGLSLLSLLKKFYYNRIPVIIISSLGKEKAETISLNLGAFSFIPKPIDFEDLIRQVHTMIHAPKAQEI